MNIELPDDFVLSLDELINGDVEIGISARATKDHTIEINGVVHTRGVHKIAKATIPNNRLEIVREFLSTI